MWTSEADPRVSGLSATLLWRGIRIDPTLAASLLMSSRGGVSVSWRYDSSCAPAFFRFFLPCYGILQILPRHPSIPLPPSSRILLVDNADRAGGEQARGTRSSDACERTSRFRAAFPLLPSQKPCGRLSNSKQQVLLSAGESRYLVLSNATDIDASEHIRMVPGGSLIELMPFGATFVGFSQAPPNGAKS